MFNLGQFGDCADLEDHPISTRIVSLRPTIPSMVADI